MLIHRTIINEICALKSSVQHKAIMERKLPESIKLSIAKKIENNLFSKVFNGFD
jgi:hypothetical protein